MIDMLTVLHRITGVHHAQQITVSAAMPDVKTNCCANEMVSL